MQGMWLLSDQFKYFCFHIIYLDVQWILDVGEQKLFEIFPKMEKNVEWRVRTTIKDTAALTGKPTGECIGIAQCVGQTGMYKPKSESPVKGLILAGCDAGARGVGTEQAASSGIYAATLVDQ